MLLPKQARPIERGAITTRVNGGITPNAYSCTDCSDSSCISPSPTWCEKCCSEICPPV